MKRISPFSTLANFSAVLLLVVLIALPFYFANNFSKIAGVKSQTPYLLISQIDKFPNLKLSQVGNTYQITFTKNSPFQLFSSVLILNNPTQNTKTYKIIKTNGEAAVFFGESESSISIKTIAPSSVSVPISILSKGSPDTQIVEFKIEAQ